MVPASRRSRPRGDRVPSGDRGGRTRYADRPQRRCSGPRDRGRVPAVGRPARHRAARVRLRHRECPALRALHRAGPPGRTESGGAVGSTGSRWPCCVAAVIALPLGIGQAAPAFVDPIALAAGIGVGVTSSVVPYVCDQLAMARLTRGAYALMVVLLPGDRHRDRGRRPRADPVGSSRWPGSRSWSRASPCIGNRPHAAEWEQSEMRAALAGDRLGPDPASQQIPAL